MTKAKSKKSKVSVTWLPRLLKAMWICFGLFLLFIFLYVFAVKGDWFGLFGGMPSVKALENPENELASELYSSDNELLGKYFRPNSNRSPARYDDLSPNLVHALKATEDIRFEEHSGIDPKSILRAVAGVVTFNRKGGGSTLSQQLAKNLFQTRGEDYDGTLMRVIKNNDIKTIVQKSKEWIISVELEKNFTKDEILAMYLNTVDFGGNTFGIKVASRTFFNTTPDSLSVQEAAVLVGLVQAPSFYNPVRNPENSTTRRNVVLAQMAKYQYISENMLDSITALPIEIDYEVQNQNVGLATYFRTVTGNFLRDWAEANGHDLYGDGLKIYTTIDSKLQQYAEEAMAENMKPLQERFVKHLNGRDPWVDENNYVIKDFLKSSMARTELFRNLQSKYGEGNDSIEIVLNMPKPMTIFSWGGEIDTVMSSIDSLRYYKHFLQSGFMAQDPHTGHIKAWVGGINHKYFKYDHVKQGKRQPGSTFKPIVYTTAIENGYSPCFTLLDAKVTFDIPGGKWSPDNAMGKYTGELMTIRKAMSNSVNSITASMMQKVGPPEVVKMAERLGIQSKLEAVPALCLGVNDVSLFELVGAYSTFVNKGTHITPFFITRIEDKNGNILQEFPPKTFEAINEETAYLMIHMLKGAIEEEGGAGLGLSYEVRSGNEIGAKTGTTQNASDGWFVGVTKDLVAGAWVGGDDRSIHFRDWPSGQGSRTARPIWNTFMEKIYTDKSTGIEKGPFPRPLRRLSVEIDCDQYQDLNAASDSLNVDLPKNNTNVDDIR
ncbi:MAG: transglycosylase domain-containing protein [Cyclobacteriaceae bacterium]|nr:transglycosylase domain-containing protein [Cyclobacteriaceae bacterium]